MNITKNPFSLVEKEAISNFVFPNVEVLSDLKARLERSNNLKKAMSLGNLFKNKVEIQFEDNEDLKKVRTTIWGVTEKYIILKSNRLIPLNRIHQISF